MKFLFSLKGTVSRKEYVSFVLWGILTTAVVAIFFSVGFVLTIAMTMSSVTVSYSNIALTGLAILLLLFCSLYTIAYWVVTAKRLHGAGKSRKLVFLGFIGFFIIPVVMGLSCADVNV